jgi:hypothetical protein
MSDFHGPEQSEKLYDALEKDQQFEVGELSEDESIAVRERMAALDRFFQKRVVARYKIEVQFGKGRSTWKPFAGAISLFLSGSMLHGGGDEKLYLCPREDCRGIIFPNERLGAQVMCRSCEMMWNENDLVGELLFKLVPRDWATVIHKLFVKLDHNADIYLKYHQTDIRYKAAMEVAKKRGGEEIAKARKNRGLHIYPLKNIIRDTGAGAQLYDRFFAFITN